MVCFMLVFGWNLETQSWPSLMGGDRNAHRLSSRGVKAVTKRYTGVCGAQGSYLPLKYEELRLLRGGDVGPGP